LFKGWGIEMPQRGQGQGGPGGPGKGLGANLTEEQKTQLHAKIKEMRDAGAKPEEIKAAVAELFKGWGLEMPERGLRQGGQGQGGPGGPGKGLGANLTEEQKTQLHAKIKEMRDAGAKPEEIKAAVAELFKGWGLEMPERGLRQGGPGQGQGPLQGLLKDLTPEQRQQVMAKVKELRQNGATREEIKKAIEDMIKGFGDQA